MNRNRLISLFLFFLGMAAVLFPVSTVQAQSKRQVERIKQELSGRVVQMTYRVGEVVYGTYYIDTVTFCRSGQYASESQSRKQTVLDNVQPGSSRDAGQWTVIYSQGQYFIQFSSRYGSVNYLPVALYRNGSISMGNGVSARFLGRARC